MGEAQWSGSAGVFCIVEPLLVGLGGSRQACWIIRRMRWMLLARGQKVPVRWPKLAVERVWNGDRYQSVGAPGCEGRGKAEPPGLIFAKREAGGWEVGCCRGGCVAVTFGCD